MSLVDDRSLAAEAPVSQPPIKQGTLVEPRRGPIVVLDNGGLLVAWPFGMVTTQDDSPNSVRHLQLDSALFGKVEVPVECVAGILFQLPPGTKSRDREITKFLVPPSPALPSSQAKPLTEDRVTLINGDQLDGPVLEIQGSDIIVETAFGRTTLKADRVASVVFGSSKPHEKESAQVLTGWSDGSRLPVAKLVAEPEKNGENRHVQIWPYADTKTPWTAPADQLRFIQPLLSPEITYLSDLTPSDYRHTPYLDRDLPLGRDRNVLGLPLRANVTLYLKGLGVASRSKIVYTLDEPFHRFEAALAIDDAAQGEDGTSHGSVIFRVLLDGKLVYTSPTIRGGQAPLPISIDITDAKQLELEVDYTDRADQLDYTDWLDARLIKTEK